MKSYCYFIAASWGDSAYSKHFQTLAHKIAERGHRVVYLSHGKQIRIDEGNFQLYSFPSPRPTRLQDFIFLNKLVRQYKPDCMIANFGAVNVMTIVGWLNRIPCRVAWYRTLSARNMLETNLPIWKIRLLNLRKRLVYSLATYVIANSEITRSDAVNTFNISEAKTQTFFNAISDESHLIEDDVRSSIGFIVCPGRLDYSKGQDVLIEALSYLKQDGLTPQVRFMGKGHKLQDYQELASRLGVQDQCVFAGMVPHEEVFREMAAAEITIVPSRSEAFGFVNIESMSVGTPVIASAVGGIPEIIRDGVDGFLVPPDDPLALAEKVKILLTDDKLRQEMGRNARQRFLDVFEQTKNVEKQVIWFEELVNNHR